MIEVEIKNIGNFKVITDFPIINGYIDNNDNSLVINVLDDLCQNKSYRIKLSELNWKSLIFLYKNGYYVG